jgi:hypothetical protein
MAPGDSQEVVAAVIIGQGSDRIASINDLKSKDATAQLVFDLNFDTPAPPPIVLPATVDLDPNVINLESRAPMVTAYIEVPDFDLVSIDLSSVRLAGSVPAESKFAVVGDHDQDGIPDLAVKFGRSALDPLLAIGVNELAVTGSLTTGEVFRGVDVVRVVEPPGASLLPSVAPNPLNPAGALTFVTTGDGPIRVTIFDLHGRVVRTLMDGRIMPAGRQEIAIDGRGAGGEELSSGVYFYRLEAGDAVSTGRCVIAR